MSYSAVNTIWVLVGAALVFFMQAGFAMVETGFTRAKNAGNIIMKNLMDFCIGTPVFWLVGFGIMFGTGQRLYRKDRRTCFRSKLWQCNASRWRSLLGISDFPDRILRYICYHRFRGYG